MNNFCLKLIVFLPLCLFLFSPPAFAESDTDKAEASLAIPVNIETDTFFYADTKRGFKCVINKNWLKNEVNENSVIFYSPEERFFINFSRNPLRAMYNNVPEKDRKLTWKEFFSAMTDKNVFEQFSKDIALGSSRSIAKEAKIISSEGLKISNLAAILTKIEGAMPEKNMKFEARDITFIDGEDIFTIDSRVFFTGNKSSGQEKEFSSLIKQVLNTFESTKKWKE